MTFEEKMNDVSDLIKRCQTKMQDNLYVCPAVYEELEWKKHGSRMRICVKGKPLDEHPFEVRAVAIHHLPGLMQRAKNEMLKVLSKADYQEIDTVHDILNQMER